MKCPKCGYLGFEDSDRCRNCGYDFSLVQPDRAGPEVFVHPEPPTLGPDPDFLLATTAESGNDALSSTVMSVDLDHLRDVPSPAVPEPPLFGSRPGDDLPLIGTPSPPRAPLAVRRATPEVPRARTRTPRPQTGSLDLEAAPVAALGLARSASGEPSEGAAAPLSRVLAAMLDLTIVLGVDAGIVYFTLRLCELQPGDVFRLPVVPLLVFLLLLNGGYFVAFTAVGGQSIGQMALGIRVVGQERQPVTFGRATVRALVCLASALPFGLGFLPALVGRDRRALHDRIARTRVIRPSSR